MTQFTQTYPTDLQYTEWLLIMQFFPPSKRGRPPKWEMWQIINAILYVTRTGCQWRMLPKDMPPWQTVYGYFWRWTKSGRWATINATLVCQVRQKQGRDSKPSAAILDSQSVKTSEGGEARGVDVHKQTPGRKRHIVVDTLGLLLMVVVHSASVQDAAGGLLVLQRLFEQIKQCAQPLVPPPIDLGGWGVCLHRCPRSEAVRLDARDCESPNRAKRF